MNRRNEKRIIGVRSKRFYLVEEEAAATESMIGGGKMGVLRTTVAGEGKGDPCSGKPHVRLPMNGQNITAAAAAYLFSSSSGLAQQLASSNIVPF
ncbi:hypothetical protein Droror1_Dr00021848 [Drosera rotundifolia]